MCVYSMVMDYGRERVPAGEWTPLGMERFRKLLEAAREADEALRQPECEDPDKSEWMRAIELRLARLEGGLR